MSPLTHNTVHLSKTRQYVVVLDNMYVVVVIVPPGRSKEPRASPHGGHSMLEGTNPRAQASLFRL